MKFEPEELDQLAIAVADKVLAVIGERLDAGLTHTTTKVSWNEGEAAVALGISRFALRDLRLAGRITASRGKRPILYTKADLAAAMEVLSTKAK